MLDSDRGFVYLSEYIVVSLFVPALHANLCRIGGSLVKKGKIARLLWLLSEAKERREHDDSGFRMS